MFNDIIVSFQENAFLYIFISAVVATIITICVDCLKSYFSKHRNAENDGQDETAENNSDENVINTPSNSNRKKIRSWLITCFLTFFAQILLNSFNIYLPFKGENEAVYNDSSTIDGYLKLSYYDASFSYRDLENAYYYNDIDIINPSYYAYLHKSISPMVYITITDLNGQVVIDTKSEYVGDVSIGISYGDYVLTASTYNYKKYSTRISLTPDNKNANIWNHSIYFIPDTPIAYDVKIQLVNCDGIPYSSSDAHIGYSGYSLGAETDENGFIDYKFTLAKGEYITYIDELDVSGRFYINELTQNNENIVVVLHPIPKTNEG